MSIIKDLRTVIFSFGAVFLVLSIGAYTYHTQYVPFENANIAGNSDADGVGELVITNQFEVVDDTASTSSGIESVVIISTTTVEIIPVATKTNTSSDNALEVQKAIEEESVADAFTQQIAETQAMIDALAKEKAIADAVEAQKATVGTTTAVKQSRKSRAS